MFRRDLLCGRALALIVVSALQAHAQEPPAEPPAPAVEAPPETDPRVQEARESFRLGAELARAGRWDEARTAFERSAALKTHPVTTYNLAFCSRAVGRPASALQLFQRALNEHADGTLGQMPEELVERARQYLAEAAARVARVKLVPDRGASVLVDGHPLEVFVFRGQEFYLPSEGSEKEVPPLQVEKPVVLLSPGTHVFVGKRPGYTNAVETRTLASGQEMEVALELAPPRPPAPKGGVADAPVPQASSSTLAWIAGGTGIAALGVGAAFGVGSLAAYDTAETQCPRPHQQCGSSAIEARDKAETYAWVSNIGLGVGVLGVATAAYLFFTAPSTTERKRSTGPSLVVAAGPGSSFVGLRVIAEP